MALTFSAKVGDPTTSFPVAAGSYRIDQMTHGLKVAHIEFKTSTGSTGADYTTAPTGFKIQANANKMGFRKVFWVHQPTVRDSGNTLVRIGFGYVWDLRNGTLRLFISSTGLEVTTDVAVNDIVSMIVMGV